MNLLTRTTLAALLLCATLRAQATQPSRVDALLSQAVPQLAAAAKADATDAANTVAAAKDQVIAAKDADLTATKTTLAATTQQVAALSATTQQAAQQLAAAQQAIAARDAEIARLKNPTTQPPPTPVAYKLKTKVGVNTGGSPLEDLVKGGGGWSTLGNWWDKTLPQPKYDAQGWPLEPATFVLFWDKRQGMAGDYAVTFDGKATVNAWYEGKIGGYAYDAATNKSKCVLTIFPDAQGGSNVALNFKDTTSVRNLTVKRVGRENDYLNRDWVEFHKPFGVLRSMDLQLTNVSAWVTSWDTRPKLDAVTYRPIGYPIEVLIDAANATKAAPHICIPIWADADYQRKAFELIKARLDPSLPAYVEYGNENWNEGVAPVKAYFSEQSKVPANGGNGSYNPDLRHKLPFLFAWRCAGIGQEVFKDQPGRLRFVLNVQVANYWRDSGNLNWLARQIAPAKPADRIYCLAFALYTPWTGDRAAMSTLTTADQVNDFCLSTLTRPWVGGDVAQWVTLTDQYGLKRHLYECGTEWPEGGDPGNARLAAQSDPKAGQFVAGLLDKLAAEVKPESMTWNGSVGSWAGGKPYGLAPSLTATAGPKYRAAVTAAGRYAE